MIVHYRVVLARPDGVKIASLFLLAIGVASFVSPAMRTTEVRIQKIVFDKLAQRFIDDSAHGEIRIVTNRRETGDATEYRLKEFD